MYIVFEQFVTPPYVINRTRTSQNFSNYLTFVRQTGTLCLESRRQWGGVCMGFAAPSGVIRTSYNITTNFVFPAYQTPYGPTPYECYISNRYRLVPKEIFEYSVHGLNGSRTVSCTRYFKVITLCKIVVNAIKNLIGFDSVNQSKLFTK